MKQQKNYPALYLLGAIVCFVLTAMIGIGEIIYTVVRMAS